MTREWWEDDTDKINEGAEVGFQQHSLCKGYGKSEETALVGRLWIQMGPSQSERGILDGKAGRYLLKCHLQMPKYVLFSFPKCFCEFLIDSNYSYLNVRILLFQSESIKVFEAFYQCNMCTVKHTNLVSSWVSFHSSFKGGSTRSRTSIVSPSIPRVIPSSPYTHPPRVTP